MRPRRASPRGGAIDRGFGMRKRILISLAAGAAFISATAAAQPSPRGPGHSWSHGNSNVMVRQGGHQMRSFGHPGKNFRYSRLQRGFFVHPYWFGPQFHVQNWQLYGFARPPSDHRWVRHYDDAYLIDRHGRVAETRYDLDWDEYGERWALEDGIPHYDGRNDWRPDEEDYAWVEGHGGHRDRDETEYASRRHHDGPMTDCHAPQPCVSHSYPPPAYPGYAYPGPGYGIVYPIIIETTVTTHGCCEAVTEEVVEIRQRPQRRKTVPVVRPRPRPPAGERG